MVFWHSCAGLYSTHLPLFLSATLVEAWDSELVALVKWLEQFPFPPAPFKIGHALTVVDVEVFLKDVYLMIDRCEFQKEQIAPLRVRLKDLKAWMEEEVALT